MKTYRTGWKKGICGLLCFLLAAGLLISSASAVQSETILASYALKKFQRTRADGSEINLIRDETLRGRGLDGGAGVQPDYIGLVGYAVIANNPKRAADTRLMDWSVQTYLKKGDKVKKSDVIAHKTPVVVVDQDLRQSKDGVSWYGYLEVIRLDREELCWISVWEFVSTPYWNYRLKDAVKRGWCVAVYRDASRIPPRSIQEKNLSLRDGTRVLLPAVGIYTYESPNPEKLPIQGILFEKKNGKTNRMFAFFSDKDLTLIY